MSDFDKANISFFLNNVDQVGANVVARTYHNLVIHYSAVFYTLTTIYIGFLFLKMLRGYCDFNDFVIIILRTVVILTLAMKYDYFCLFIYDVVTNEPLQLCKAIILQGNESSVVSIATALDHFLSAGIDAGCKVCGMGSWTNPTYTLFGVFLLLFVLLASAIAAGLIVLAKCATFFLLALSPLFIFFALFDSTKGFFETYLRQLISYALIPVMVCATLMILLSVGDVAIKSFNEHVVTNVMSLFPLSLVCVIQIYLLLHVKNQCASLCGGFSLPGIVSTLKNYKNEIFGGSEIVNKKIEALKQKVHSLTY